MLAISIGLFGFLLLLLGLQIPYGLDFVRRLKAEQLRANQRLNPSPSSSEPTSKAAQTLEQEPDQKLPKTTIILCLRGSDPFLADCITQLLKQDYPDYSLHIVIDNPQDPAWDVVRSAIATVQRSDQRTIPVQINSLRTRYSTCSLKCSALLQAVSELAPDCEAVALVDADTVTHATWLQELVTPLQNPQVGATTGNRWYMPQEEGWGELTRYLWNSSVIVYMHKYTIPWGGSMAVRAEILRQPKLLQRWQHSLVEDVTLYQVLASQGLAVQPVLSTLMVNRESCTLPNFFRWLQRQFVFVRLYHPSWSESLGYNTVFLTTLLCTYGMLAVASLTHHWQAAAWAGAILLINLSIGLLLLVSIHRQVCCNLALRGEVLTPLSGLALLKLLPALLLSQIFCGLALVSSQSIRQITWRGITYQIHGPNQIQLLQYDAYQPVGQANSIVSL
jgi:cellulose synthase/poly-beta-1,6-N-acetylglucosamine synthase-like glycosyltransferase